MDLGLDRDNDANAAAQSQAGFPDYEADAATFAKFLQEYTILRVANQDAEDDENVLLEPGQNEHQSLVRVPCYPPILQKLVNRDFEGPCLVLEIPLNDLIAWDASRGKDLADKSMQNTLRYKALFSAVLDEHLKTLQPEPGHAVVRDTLDILQQQREEAQELQRNEQNVAGGGDNNNADGLLDNQGVANDAAENGRAANQNGNGATEDFPPLLQRRYELRILPIGRNGSLAPFDVQVHPNDNATFESESTSVDGVSLRTIRSKSMGKLVTLKGMVVRASDVKPYCQVATYSCDACGCEIYQVLEGKREFMPQRMCPSRECQNDRRTRLDTLHLQTRGSKFAKFQELKLQELPHQVPMGHVPRSMSVYCRGELTRLASPGDVVTIDGVFLPQRVAEGGYRAMKAGLVATLFLEAQNIIVHKKSYDESLLDSLSEKESARLDTEILEIATSEDPIGMLSSSIAPEIFGHEDIKRSLLLQLVGGVTRKLPDGMRIRGDINICLMGDPGVAKSQLLKHVASIAPRGVYTTGKGSSGVGLTAAITKDTSTGELSLEGGALVLADRGICAIDEFDKMDEADRTAIHEVMEQQTVSIAKAGIVATLNARAAVLAAANPLYSRYNRKKSLSENINLPNSLLSRFDLMFLILDVADVDRDMALARHVTLVHKNEGVEPNQDNDDSDDEDADMDFSEDAAGNKTVSSKLLREYIARARKHQPVVPPDVAPYVVEAYVSLRMQDRPGPRGSNKSGDQTVMTARQLLSILRLSQALARLRFSDYVAREDVDEAIRLTHMSKATLLEEENGPNQTNARREDVMSRIFNILREYSSTSNSTSLEMKLCEAMVLRKGFTVQQLKSCLEEYESLEIIQVNQSRTQVHFIS